ncbi:3-hydroxyacyl-CoA dehydrogenase family protein [Candidatus Stoquefichus sp. SB1]|uniref:3-hydroxyacyl-CoA dehydrogenase family protein n=1 Tax=Candidatus Stoquefichus sp. SB1 TaxID=1658109 RepID=UPI00067EA1C4|nr:3-hydroxyacyl-CoA dehydrogenase family protein [Candidatus Stoquefichus sp. SB1]
MNIQTVTVVGANGTMGRNVSAIFASFGEAKVYMVCRTEEKAKKAAVQSYQSVKAESIQNRLIPATYNELEKCISESDLVFESVSEDFDIKMSVYEKIKKYLKTNAIVATGTSGLSIQKLSEIFGNNAHRFFGIHMFNPPYNLSLCELVVHSDQQKELARELREYLSNVLGRTVVEVRDSPSFLGNRIGFYFIGEAMRLANENMDQGGIDYIDSILGCFTGRNMSPLATADFVGLDVTQSILDYIQDETSDEFNSSFISQDYLMDLINDNKLGRKTNYGLYHKDRDTGNFYVYDIRQKCYRLKNEYRFYFANEMIEYIRTGDYDKAFLLLIEDESHEAVICKKMLLQYILYSLKISQEVSTDISTCDDAMATGFSWIPPIALIEVLGGMGRIKKLAERYLDDRFVNLVSDEHFLEGVPSHSKYDYRPFLKAKY